jgi:anaerobic selenocysteine-containing dehydrogenase
MHSNGIYTRMAIHALNALVGSIDVPGGVVFPHKVPEREEL